MLWIDYIRFDAQDHLDATVSETLAMNGSVLYEVIAKRDHAIVAAVISVKFSD